MASSATPSLDIERHDQLIAYLRQTGRIAPDEASPQVRTLAGGVSNKTVYVRRTTGETWVLKQALPKLRVQVDWFSDPARIGREALGLEWLAKLAPPGTITPLVFEDPPQYLLAMQAVPEPHENWKSMLLRRRLDFDHVEQFASLLAEVHRRSAASAATMRERFEDCTFFESLRLEPYYAYAAAQVPEAAAFLNDLIAATRARRICLVHGDYSPKNVLVHDGRVILLDHEVIHWGDPAFDIGFAMTHLISKAHHFRDARFIEAAVTFCEGYAVNAGPAIWSAALDAMAVRHTLGCLLARVAGRSPLEYLDADERARQRDAAVEAMRRPPTSMRKLLARLPTMLHFSASGGRT
jgi:aminoglycoside phosphotransferase (APT) family kinase protein